MQEDVCGGGWETCLGVLRTPLLLLTNPFGSKELVPHMGSLRFLWYVLADEPLLANITAFVYDIPVQHRGTRL